MVELIILLILVGAALYIVSLLPLDATIKTIIYVVIVVAVAIYAIRLLAPSLPALG